MRNPQRIVNTSSLVLSLCMTAATLSSCSSSGNDSTKGSGGTSNLGSGGSTNATAGGSSSSATSVAGCNSVSLGGTASGAWPIINVELVAAATDVEAHTQLIGYPWDGPSIPQYPLTKMASVGACELLKVKNVLCDPPACDAETFKCVGSNEWARIPGKVTIGDLKFSGLTLLSGGTSFTLSPTNDMYQATGASALAYPPCAVGTNVTVANDASAANAFSLTTQCIEPLVVTSAAPLAFEQSKALELTWTARSAGNSRISVEIDISHHGGLKGYIRCDADDTGSLTVDATLVTGLIGLGTAGFPEARLIRHNTGTTAVGAGTATLNVQTATTRVALQIPGVVSCNDENPCPSGQSCVSLKCQ